MGNITTFFKLVMLQRKNVYTQTLHLVDSQNI